MLSTQERDKLREVLMAEKQRLLRNAQEGLSFAMNRDRTIGRDSIDESMEEELFSTELRLRDREKWLLLKINSALDRLEAGSIDECEVAFEGLARSTRHKSGLAMRFPRISRLRWDKRPADADRIETLERLLTASAARDGD